MTDAILEITDGTTTISLINPSSGFHMISWTPGITDYKGGGVFTNPPLADWRQLRVGKWDTVQEQFGLTIDAANPNGAAYMLQELRRLLEKANAYWTTDWQNDPVYLVAKAKCETETRYCLIVKGRLANDQNYYQQPFAGKRSTMQDLPLIIERRAWLGNPPGQGDDIAISASEDYDGRTYGVAIATDAAETVIISGGKRNEANLTDVYIFDDSGASFSSNLLDAALPQFLLPASTTVDDAIYFIIDTSLTDSGPFDNVVFNISQAASSTGTYDGTWEYWNGAWTAFPANDIYDDTDNGSGPFSKIGVVSLTFEQKSDWVTTTVNGITGYAIRMRVSTLTGTFTRPQQAERIIYSAVWSYVEVAGNTVPGDITALSQIRLWPYGQQPGESLTTLYVPQVFVGLRSVDRGASFTPYINTVQEQNSSDISISSITGISLFVDDIRSPTGRALQFSPGGSVSVDERIRIQFRNAIAPEYVGKYRCFLRFRQVSGSATYTFRLRVATNNFVTSFTSNSVEGNGVVSAPYFYTYVDFGELSLGAFSGVIKNADESSQFHILIDIGSSAAGSINIIDLVLMPIDEWSGMFTGRGGIPFTLIQNVPNKSILFDSVEFPKKPARAFIHDDNERVVENMQSTINGPVMLQAGKTQKYYFFASDVTTPTSPNAFTTYTMAVQVNRVAQYLSLRGER